jgi:hypothetical protein
LIFHEADLFVETIVGLNDLPPVSGGVCIDEIDALLPGQQIILIFVLDLATSSSCFVA